MKILAISKTEPRMFKCPPERSLCGLYSLCSPWLFSCSLSWQLFGQIVQHSLGASSPPLNVLSAMPQTLAAVSIWKDADLKNALNLTGHSQCRSANEHTLSARALSSLCETHLYSPPIANRRRENGYSYLFLIHSNPLSRH